MEAVWLAVVIGFFGCIAVYCIGDAIARVYEAKYRGEADVSEEEV